MPKSFTGFNQADRFRYDLGIVAKTGCAVSAENASIIAGFGAAVAEVLVENYPVPLKRIGVRDQWIDSGEIEELFTYYKMQPEDIAVAALESIKLKESRAK